MNLDLFPDTIEIKDKYNKDERINIVCNLGILAVLIGAVAPIICLFLFPGFLSQSLFFYSCFILASMLRALITPRSAAKIYNNALNKW